ncbi:MAG: helix-turn-helix domain-containing protein [Pseudomonadota bacterium]
MSANGAGKSPFLTSEEAALYLRVSEGTIRNWRVVGIGPKYRHHGRRIVYHVDDLNSFNGWGRANDTSD